MASFRELLIRFLEAPDRRKAAVWVDAEDVVFLEIDDVLAVHCAEFGKNGRPGNDVGARGLGEAFDSGERFARGNDVVNERNALPANLVGVAAVKPEGLVLLRRDGKDMVRNRIHHVGLAALSSDDEFLHAHDAAHLVREADAFGFGRHEIVDLRQALYKLRGNRLNQLGVGEADKARKSEFVGDLHIGELAGKAADFKVKILHGWRGSWLELARAVGGLFDRAAFYNLGGLNGMMTTERFRDA